MSRFATLPEGKTVPEHEHYITPSAFAEWPIRHLLGTASFGDVLDAGAGTGPFGLAYQNFGHADDVLWGLDIRDISNPGPYDIWVKNTDYLTWETPKQFGAIIGNPPFSYSEEWIRKSMSLLRRSGKLVLLLQQNFLASAKRLQLWRDHQPYCIVTCANRPRFYAHTKGTGDLIYMYVMWVKGEPKMTTWSAALIK